MFISLHELQLHHDELAFDEQWQAGTIDLGPDVRQSQPLRSSGRALLVHEHHGRKGNIQDIRLQGGFSTQVQVLCARCLDPVTRELRRDFDLLYRPQGSDAGQEELPLNKTDVDVGYYRGDGVVLEEVLREQLLLAIPIKTVCRDDCRGLCPQCGRNLDAGTCDCPEPASDARWTGLRSIRDKLNE